MIYWIYDLDFTLYGYDGNPNGAFQYQKILEYPNLKQKIKSLPGKKILFTNGNLLHTLACVKQLSLQRVFHKVSCRELHGLKPDPKSYHILNQLCSIKPEDTCYFFEDTLDNLIEAKKFGWKTVYLEPNPKTLSYVKNNFPELDYAFKDVNEALQYFSENK